MKTILVDAIHCFVIKNEGVFNEMHTLLETYPQKKIVLTGADDEQVEKYGLDKIPYQLFTLKHNPEKSDPNYYKIMLDQLDLHPKDAVYFEHDYDAVQSAESVGITTYHYSSEERDLQKLKDFLDRALLTEQ